jgi:actin related protein 2/3 complex subunit 2
MILLEYSNRIIQDTILDKIAYASDSNNEVKFESIEAIIADFDGVTFHLFTDPTAKNLLSISMSIKCWAELAKNGVDQIMQQVYGQYLVSTEQGYDITVQVDLASPPADTAKFAQTIGLLKRNAFAAPFYKTFSDVEAKKAPGGIIEVHYRDEEAVYLKQENDRVIVIFQIQFKDADDIVLAKVFLQEFADARKTMTNVPSVMFSQKEPPLELKGVRSLKADASNGFVSFVLFAPHITGSKKERTIDNIETFRNYLHYHIKCSKAYLHTRMRNRVRAFLQVLNRARSDLHGGKKTTMTGRTFTRADDPQGNQKQDDDFVNL